MSKPFAWSYSALTTFESCPKKYYHLNVAKDIKDGDNEWSGEGKQIHDALYKRIIKGTPLPLEFRHLEKIAKKFADTPGKKHGEIKQALTREFEPAGFFDDGVYIRSIIDLLIVRDNKALVIDWKTGKVKDDFTQLSMSAAVLSQYMPEIEQFTIMYVWLKANKVSPMTFTREQLRGVWPDLIRRATAIEEARKTTSFPAKPSGLCRGWCPVHTCPHWESRD